jgi:hypothetical protein
MNMSSELDAKISAAVKAFAEARQETHAIEREVLDHARRTRRIGNAYRHKLLEQVVANASIDPLVLEKRHALSEASDRRFFEAMKLRIDTNSERIAQQQKVRIDAFRRRFPEPDPVPPPANHAGTIIATADKMGFLAPPGNAEVSFSAGQFNNLIRFLIPTEEYLDFMAYAAFSWTVPISGTLDVLSLCVPNGSYRYSSQYKCIEADGTLELNSFLQISVNGVVDPLACGGEGLLYEYWDSHCPVSGSGILSQPADLEMTYPVVAGDEIVIFVCVEALSWADYSHTEMDFLTAAKQINVPGMIFNVS